MAAVRPARDFVFDLLRCPVCGHDASVDADAVTCAGCGARYRTLDGVPAMVLGQAADADGGRGGLLTRAIHRAVANPWVYDRVQRLFGAGEAARRLAPHLARLDGGTTLDVGAGTGTIRELLPPSATYLWLDNDPAKLRGYRGKAPSAPAVLSDATSIALKDKVADYAVCVAVSHHLADAVLPLLFQEIARVTKETLVFLDAVREPRSAVSRALWRYDRGAHPRTEEELLSALARDFVVDRVERFRTWHRFLLCTATPRPGTTVPQRYPEPQRDA